MAKTVRDKITKVNLRLGFLRPKCLGFTGGGKTKILFPKPKVRGSNPFGTAI